jgi:hypothetical protein
MPGYGCGLHTVGPGPAVRKDFQNNEKETGVNSDNNERECSQGKEGPPNIRVAIRAATCHKPIAYHVFLAVRRLAAASFDGWPSLKEGVVSSVIAEVFLSLEETCAWERWE